MYYLFELKHPIEIDKASASVSSTRVAKFEDANTFPATLNEETYYLPFRVYKTQDTFRISWVQPNEGVVVLSDVMNFYPITEEYAAYHFIVGIP